MNQNKGDTLGISCTKLRTTGLYLQENPTKPNLKMVINSNNLSLVHSIPNEPIQDFQANIQHHTDNTSMKTLNTVLVTMDLKATIMQWPQRIETAQTTITGQWTNMNFTKIMQVALRTDQ
ncbi:hypothetical protein M8J75_014086 [Diaphorina citri]|nr:hypothetical protein M8J75_014086 [Diaphorina citri]